MRLPIKHSPKLSNKAKGALGEKIAKKYLKKKGYKIVTMNYETDIGEIDIIAILDNILVFVEVKYRTSEIYYRPSDAVKSRKMGKIAKVANQFLVRHKLTRANFRFDIIEIVGERKEINHIEDAFQSFQKY